MRERFDYRDLHLDDERFAKRVNGVVRLLDSMSYAQAIRALEQAGILLGASSVVHTAGAEFPAAGSGGTTKAGTGFNS